MISKEHIITGAMLMLVTYTLGLSLIGQAFPVDQTTRTLSSTGSIQIQTTAGIGIYYDYQGNTALTSVSWGTLQPGGSQAVIIYIKNEGSSATIISLHSVGPTSSAITAILVNEAALRLAPPMRAPSILG